MNTISEKELFTQTSLTPKRLKECLTPKKEFVSQSIRPKSSLVDLINWVASELDMDQTKYGSYIHNKIVVDGSFVYFCENTDTKITCLIKDSIASWNTDYDTEQFIAQGVFKVERKNFTFYHCSLFHKGSQNEDEVSFFTLVENKYYKEYIDFRNEYEKWVNDRESSSQDIYVVGGEPISYETNLTWEDVIIPDDVLNEIKTSVEGFLKAESFYKKNNIPWKRGLIFWGPAGCGKTQVIKILLSQYGFKPVTIQPGHPQKDQLLEEAFDYAESHGPSLLFLEDFPELIAGSNESHFLQLLDGIKSKEGLLVIATANDLSNIPKNITDRPSRFDRKIFFPNPDKNTALSYLKSKFGNKLKAKEYSLVVKKCIDHKFSFAYLKELYVTSAHIAVSDNRTYQNYNDVERALESLCKDKGYVQTGFGLSSTKVLDMSGFLDDE